MERAEITIHLLPAPGGQRRRNVIIRCISGALAAEMSLTYRGRPRWSVADFWKSIAEGQVYDLFGHADCALKSFERGYLDKPHQFVFEQRHPAQAPPRRRAKVKKRAIRAKSRR